MSELPPSVATKEIEGATLTVEAVDNGIMDPHYCGYAIFDEDPIEYGGYDGIVGYVPVHGGVTFCGRDVEGRRSYGFDCGHAGDDQDLDCLRKAWVLAEAERMALSIIALGTIETQIVAAMDEIWGHDGQV